MEAQELRRAPVGRTNKRPESLRQRVLRRLRSWPATASELSEDLGVAREAIYGVIVKLDAADRIEMRGKKDQSIRVWNLRPASATRHTRPCGKRKAVL